MSPFSGWLRPGPAHLAANDLAKLVRVTRDLPRFLRAPVGVEEARGIVKGRLATREARFLAMARRAIYGWPACPYLKLLRGAGCEFDDLKSMLESDGLEGALARLAEAGVYLLSAWLAARDTNTSIFCNRTWRTWVSGGTSKVSGPSSALSPPTSTQEWSRSLV